MVFGLMSPMMLSILYTISNKGFFTLPKSNNYLLLFSVCSNYVLHIFILWISLLFIKEGISGLCTCKFFK